MSDIFYDDEQHRNEEYAEDGRNGCAKDDGDALYIPADRELPQRTVKCRDHHVDPEKNPGDDDRHERLDYLFCPYLIHAIFSFL